MNTPPQKTPAGTRLLLTLSAALLAFLVAGCDQNGNASPNSGTSSTPKTSAGAATPKTSSQTTSSSKGAATGPGTGGSQGETSSKKHSSGPSGASPAKGERVVLRLAGDSGVKFSGSCTVNGKKENLSGKVPERFVYRLGKGENLSCEVRKQGKNGVLRAVLKSKNGTSTYQTNVPGGVARASLTGGSGVAQSVSQTSSVNQSGGSNSVHSSQSVVVSQSGNSSSYSKTTSSSR